MTKTEAQIIKSRKRIAKLKQQQREQEAKRKAQLKPKPSGKRGRPPIDESLIVRAIQMAETKSLPDVALSLSVSLKTLLRYGVTRRALNAQADLETEEERSKK